MVARYVWLEGDNSSYEEICRMRLKFRTAPIVGLLRQHEVCCEVATPTNSRVVPAVMTEGSCSIRPAFTDHEDEEVFIGCFSPDENPDPKLVTSFVNSLRNSYWFALPEEKRKIA